MRRLIGLVFASLSTFVAVFFVSGLFSPVTFAIPAFARKTGLACSACHEVWPRLNDFGQQFRDRGYRLERDRDDPVDQDPSYWPITFRTTVGYQWVRNNLVPTDQGTTTTDTGTFGFTGLDVFAAGTLGNHLSFLITYTPGLASSGFQLSPTNLNSDLESAWMGFNSIGGTPWANIRVGKHALDAPIDEHRTITLTQGYNVYHYHPQGSTVAWAPGDNQNGVELYGHSDLSRVRYSFSFVNERDAAFFSRNFVSNPVLWGHVTAQQYLDNPLLAAVKIGAFGSIGWHPTQSLTLTAPGAGGAPGTPAPVSGTGFNLKTHRRYGAEAHLQFFSIVNPLTVTGVFWAGSEDKALADPAVFTSFDAGCPGAGLRCAQDATFYGGFVEGVWTITPRLSFVGRWERIINNNAFDPGVFGAAGNLTAVTGVIRHTFELTSRTEAALHLEVSRVGIEAPDGTVPDTITGLVGFDMAL